MDNLSARAELEVIVTGLDKAVSQFEHLYESTGEKQWDKYGRTVARVSGQIKGTAASASGATGATEGLAAAQAKANKETEESISALPRLRYALYDVATTAGVMSTAIIGAGAATGVLSARFESAFTGVQRTLEPGTAFVSDLRQELTQLTREIPLAFSEVARIAQLGNQLGIAGQDVAKFTETVARFSAITGVSVDEAGKAFGAMQYSLKVPASEFENLSSAITLVGRMSVATEPEILSLVREIGTQANQAGFAADQVVALAGTLGQLRVPPERARGSLTTYFQTLNQAVAEGGPRLEAFARVVGVSSEELSKMVRNGQGVEVFQRFVNALGDTDNVVEVTSALDDLGLSQLRVSDVFQRLAGSSSTFTDFLAIGKKGYDEGTESARQYAMVVDDLASKWQIFLNSLAEAGAAVGSVLAVGLKPALDILSRLFQGLAAIASTPFGQWAIGIAAVIGTVVAALSGLVATSALGIASMAALRTAMVSLNITSGASIFTFRGLSAAVSSVGVAMGFTTAGVNTFKVALASTGIGLAVVALGTLATAFFMAGDAAGGFNESLRPMADSLSEAINADTQAWKDTGTYVALARKEITQVEPAATKAYDAMVLYAGVQSDVSDSTDAATKKIQEQTVALGENADAVVRKTLLELPGFKDLANNPELRATAEQFGFSIDELITNAMKSKNGASAYIQQIQAEADRIRNSIPTDTTQWTQSTYDAIAYRDSLYALYDAVVPVASGLDGVRTEALRTGEAFNYAGVAINQSGAEAENYGSQVVSAIDALIAVQQASLDTESRMYALGTSLGENAGMWDVFSEGGRANLGALYALLDAIAAETPGNTAAIAANFQALYNALIAGGFATEQQLAAIQARIVALSGGGTVVAAQRDFSSLFNGIQVGATKAARAVGGRGGGGSGGLAKEIRTLVDYGRDLASVFSRAFDLRFGSQDALDEISSKWLDIREETEQAAQKVAEYKQKLRELSASRDTLEYQLKVAVEYKDTERAAEIRAELAKNSLDTAKTQGDLSKAQDENSKTTKGNSKAAIENRAKLRDLIKSNQDYIVTLAENGASQKEIDRAVRNGKQAFIEQAVALGYNRDEVVKVAGAFDDMITIVKKVPRNVTVGANTDPAIQALNEFMAKVKKAKANVGIGATGDGYGAGVKAGNAYGKGWAEAVAKQRRIVTVKDNSVPGGFKYRYANSGGDAPYWFKKGGYTGNVGVNQPAGIVHGREFVMSAPAVRAAGGPNAMNAWHEMLKSGKMYMPVAQAGGSAMTALEMDYLARRIAYWQSPAVITTEQIRSANGRSTAVANSQGRG